MRRLHRCKNRPIRVQSVQKLRSRSEGIQGWGREGCCDWAGICHPQWRESPQSHNVTMEVDQFIVAQGYHLYLADNVFVDDCQVGLCLRICSHLRSPRALILVLIGSFRRITASDWLNVDIATSAVDDKMRTRHFSAKLSSSCHI